MKKIILFSILLILVTTNVFAGDTKRGTITPMGGGSYSYTETSSPNMAQAFQTGYQAGGRFDGVNTGLSSLLGMMIQRKAQSQQPVVIYQNVPQQVNYTTQTTEEASEDNNDWVKDLANIIDSEYRTKIDAATKELKKEANLGILVVTSDSIPDNPAEYTSSLFSAYHIGRYNNVVMNLMIDRTTNRWYAHITPGISVSKVLTEKECTTILYEMKPYLEKNNYGLALYKGLGRIASIVAKIDIDKDFTKLKNNYAVSSLGYTQKLKEIGLGILIVCFLAIFVSGTAIIVKLAVKFVSKK